MRIEGSLEFEGDDVTGLPSLFGSSSTSSSFGSTLIWIGFTIGRGCTNVFGALIGVELLSLPLIIIVDVPETEDVVEFLRISGAAICRNRFDVLM